MATGKRMKAVDRRRLVLEAAMHEFGEAGFHDVSTEAIAARAGVSQPYVFRLFGTKKDLIIASIEERSRQILEGFRLAAENKGELTALDSMAAAYTELLTVDANALRCQLHAWAAASDPEIGEAARTSYLSIWNQALELSGEDAATVRDFMAHGMLLTVVAALNIPEIYAEPLLGNSPTLKSAQES
ncbi:MAG: TetR/AcrR family transcriptional regulator [Aeromicrobium sp.]